MRDLCRGRAEGERADFHGGWKFGDGLEHCLRLGYSAYEAGDVAEVRPSNVAASVRVLTQRGVCVRVPSQGVARIGKAVKEAASR